MVAQLTHTFITYLDRISDIIPLPWFTFFGSIVEEIIAPIPSPVVMTIAGSIAGAQNETLLFVFFIALTGAVGKTAASYIMYILADKFEDIVLSKFGKFVGITHVQIEQIGSRLNKGWKDDIMLIILRAVPIIPSAPVSLLCGLIKINMRTFLSATFIGTTLRNLFYLAIGYTGIYATESLIVQLENFEIAGYIIIGVFAAGIGGYILFQHKKDLLMEKIFRPEKNKENNGI